MSLVCTLILLRLDAENVLGHMCAAGLLDAQHHLGKDYKMDKYEYDSVIA